VAFGIDKGSSGVPVMATLPDDERKDKNDNGKCGDPSPFDYAQGQDDGVKTGNGNSNRRSLRDDKQKDKQGQERTTATAKTKYGDPSAAPFTMKL
jgi:hypothetical protein